MTPRVSAWAPARWRPRHLQHHMLYPVGSCLAADQAANSTNWHLEFCVRALPEETRCLFCIQTASAKLRGTQTRTHLLKHPVSSGKSLTSQEKGKNTVAEEQSFTLGTEPSSPALHLQKNQSRIYKMPLHVAAKTWDVCQAHEKSSAKFDGTDKHRRHEQCPVFFIACLEIPWIKAGTRLT